MLLGVQFWLRAENLPVPPPLFTRGCSAEQQVLRDKRLQLRSVLARLRRELAIEDLVAYHLQDVLLLEFFWRLVRTIPTDRLCVELVKVSTSQHFVEQLFQLFSLNLHDTLRVGQMASALCMSESAFTHACSQPLGMPPAQAFLRCKLDQSTRLLEETDLSIKEIAAQLGFANPYHFTQCFKRHFGIPPSAKRRPLATAGDGSVAM